MRHLPVLVAALVLGVASPALARQHAAPRTHVPKDTLAAAPRTPKATHQHADWDVRARDYVIGYDRADGRHVSSYLRAMPTHLAPAAAAASSGSGAPVAPAAHAVVAVPSN